MRTMLKLNIGSNAAVIKGWVNIDKYHSPGVDRIHDATTPFPYLNDEISFIFSEHFIEHLNANEALFYFRECHRMLADGGVVRTATFNIDHLMTICSDDTLWKRYSKNSFKGRFKDLTRIQFFNFAVYEGGGHRYMYNPDEMIRLLQLAGFSKFNTPYMKKSKYPELCNLEYRENSTCIVEAIK